MDAYQFFQTPLALPQPHIASRALSFLPGYATRYVNDIDIELIPAVGFVKMGSTGDPVGYPNNKGDWAVYENSTISVKRSGNDCMVLVEHDAVYRNILVGFPRYGYSDASPPLNSFYDTARSLAGIDFKQGADVFQVHVYGSYVCYGIVVGDSDYSKYPVRFHYDRMVIESMMIGAWFRPTSFVMGGEIDFHDINQHKASSLHSVYGAHPPAVMIESGASISGSQGSIPSDYGFIKVFNYVQSSANPPVNFNGTQIALDGANNTVRMKLHRSRFLDPTQVVLVLFAPVLIIQYSLARNLLDFLGPLLMAV